MTEMMTWVSPKTSVQRFEANDSISACLYAICERPTKEGKIPTNILGRPTCDLHRNQGHYEYTETNTGLVHRECMCGSGASFTGESNVMEETYNDAYISELWLNTDTGNDTYKDTLVYKYNDATYTKDYMANFFTSLGNTVNSINAWWQTVYTGFFGYGDVYTHTGIVSYEGNSANHSG